MRRIVIKMTETDDLLLKNFQVVFLCDIMRDIKDKEADNGGYRLMNILFVCTGNTCRSPMAEAILASKDKSLKVKSAGIFAMYGQDANQQALQVLKEQGMELNHSSQPVINQLLEWADYVFTMTIQHKQALFFEFPHHHEKYFTIKEFVAERNKDLWKELRAAYETYARKRTLFIQAHEHKLGNIQLQLAIEKEFQEEIKDIERLEASLRDGDISDPFGGDTDVYQQTLQELDHYIERLYAKIK